MKEHITSIHKEKMKYRCEKCNKAFSHKGNMTVHIEGEQKKSTQTVLSLEAISYTIVLQSVKQVVYY